MEKFEKLEQMDKLIIRLEEIKTNQTAILAMAEQIEAENERLGFGFVGKRIRMVQENIDSSLLITSSLIERLQDHWEKVSDNDTSIKQDKAFEGSGIFTVKGRELPKIAGGYDLVQTNSGLGDNSFC